jgi:5,10-methenyltetrahydrofolate synthetase
MDQPADIAAFRTALRREKIAARQALPAENHARASARILDHLTRLLLPRPPGTIAFCWPIRAEVDCRPLVQQLMDNGWGAAMPVVVAPAAPMQFRVWSPQAPMTTDPHGIPIPDTSPSQTPDVLLLPLVAFDAAGYRLGYGGGYFDRTIANLASLTNDIAHPLTVGVGFASSAVTTIHPAPHDIPPDWIVTELGAKHFDTL